MTLSRHRITIFLSLLALLPLRAEAQKFDRGIDFLNKTIFVPKGELLFGGTISYLDYKFYDYKLLVLDGLNANGYSLSVSPLISYFFKDNLAAGARFAYKRSLVKLDQASLALTEDLAFDVSDFYNLSHTYYGYATFRNYISIANSLRFGLFNEIALCVGAGQSKLISGTGDALTGTFQNILELGIKIIPGIVVFVSNELAAEVSVGIMGFTYKKVDQLTDQIFQSSYETSNADFKIDIFSINIGISFFLPIIK